MLDTARDPTATTDVGVRGVGPDAVGLQRAQQLAQQQRVARPSSGGRRARTAATTGSPSRRATMPAVASGDSGAGRSDGRGRVQRQLGEQFVVVVLLARAQGAHDQHRQRLQPADQVGEPAQRRAVAPLHVVDGEHERPVGGEVDGQPVQPVQDGERAVRRLAAARSKTPRALAAAPASSASRRSASASSGSNSWRTAPKPNAFSSWLPRAVSTRTERSRRQPARLGEQPGLADARRALDEQQPGSPAVARSSSAARTAPSSRSRSIRSSGTRLAAGRRPAHAGGAPRPAGTCERPATARAPGSPAPAARARGRRRARRRASSGPGAAR